jgi:hypothetical protein
MVVKLAAAAATVVFLLFGLWVFGSPLSAAVADALDQSRYWSSIVFCVIWFILASFIIGKVRKERPELNWPLRGAFLLTAGVAIFIGAWTTLRDNEVNEDVPLASVTASQMAQSQGTDDGGGGASTEPDEPPPMNVELFNGEFSGIDHKGDGIAKIIKLTDGGHRLTLTEFEVSNAPDLRVYLTADVIEDDAGEFIEIERLKGNKGNQSYKLPDDVDLKKYDNVVIWCKAFDVGVAQAPLAAS